jgi:hypothetical protein
MYIGRSEREAEAAANKEETDVEGTGVKSKLIDPERSETHKDYSGVIRSLTHTDLCVYMYACMYVCMYVYTHSLTHTCTHTRVCVGTRSSLLPVWRNVRGSGWRHTVYSCNHCCRRCNPFCPSASPRAQQKTETKHTSKAYCTLCKTRAQTSCYCWRVGL